MPSWRILRHTSIEQLGFSYGDIEALGMGPEDGDVHGSAVGKGFGMYGLNSFTRL